ncbi:phosphoglycerate kinase [Oricola cellulosilytica]|uniref:Phosphoglycerate kinase n=1 Tax=Oricola cellulosilytica TaxID=1429082 RepID=A0A4V2MNL8_9HYPH|nr:phosphoglycerate kinase [Oricola cellulosilytica]TCD13389.1 phosphoglycerate kinase [Oricola cellulosilytica]
MNVSGTLDGKTVIVRADLVGGLTPEFGRYLAGLATSGARVAVLAGYGSPQGDFNAALSLRRFVKPLKEASGVPVRFVAECVGGGAEAGLADTPFGTIALLENVRFHPDERRLSRAFAIRLSALGDYFSAPGELPEPAAAWIGELAAMLPAPETNLTEPA